MINQEMGITVICNLHHLDTARSYCNRIIGMHAGSVVFDGLPSELTTEKAIEVYGTEGGSDELNQALVKTALPTVQYQGLAATT